MAEKISVIASLMVYLGAILMAYNVYSYVKYARWISEKGNWEKEKNLYYIPIILLIVFLIGYIIVGIIMKPNIVIGIILFGGSIFVAVMMYISNHTARKIQENEELQASYTAAKRASEAKSQFMSNMTHDIRTPLNAIMGFTKIAMQDDVSCEDRCSYLEKVQTSAEQLLSIVDDVLVMNRIENGRIELKSENASLRKIVNDTADLVYTQMKEKDIEFIVKADEISNDEVVCDRNHLSRAIMNLLSNACKYTQRSGKVLFEVKQTSADENKASYEIIVADNGIGMSEEFMERIFKPFERERSETVEKISGVGLGLSITKNIIDMMNGKIVVDSKKGEGSCFTIYLDLPLAKEKKEVKKNKSIDYSKIRILIVEDNEVNYEIASMFLSKHGFKIDHTDNGKNAIEKITSAKNGYYDLILMDIQMPVMDGLEATRRIRSLSERLKAKTPIIAMSGETSPESKEEAYEAGMNGYITKPVNPDEMLETIEEVLNA